MWETPFMEWIPAYTGLMFPYLANLMVHSTTLIIFGILIARAFRSRGAVVESLVLRLTLLAVLASPVASLAISSLGIRGLTVPAPRISLEEGFPQNNGGEGDSVPAVSAVEVSSGENDALFSGKLSPVSGNGSEWTTIHPAAAFPESYFWNIVTVLTLFWVVVSLYLVIRMVVCFFIVHRIRNSATDAPLQTIRECWKLSRDLEVEPPYVLQSNAVRSPFLTGLRQPAVLLPLCAEGEEPVSREVLLHELAHLARKDCFWNMLSQLTVAVLSLQPLARVLARRLEDVSDDVCDDYVVHSGASRQCYARKLLAVAERFHPSLPETTVGVGIVTFRSSLGRRVGRILDSSRKLRIHPGFGTALRLTVLCAAATALVCLTGFRMLESPHQSEPARLGKFFIVSLLEYPSPAMERKSSAAEQDTELLLTEPGRTRPEEKLSVVVDLPPQFLETDGIHGQVRNTISDAPAASGVRDTTVRTASIEPMPSKTGAPSSAPESMEKAGTVVEVEKPASGKNADVTLQRDGSSLESGQPGADPVTREKEASAVTPPPGRNPEFQSQLTDLKACFRIGEQMVESGKYGEAEEAYLAALGFEPNNPEAMNRLGRVYYLQRAYEKASACLAIAISRKPDQSVLADAHYNMGDVLLARGDLDKAMKSYKTAIQINPAYSKRVRSFY